MFKPVTDGPEGPRIEDWAEVVAAQVARRLGVPVVDVELAVRSGRRGALVRRLTDLDQALHTGSVLLAQDERYDPEDTVTCRGHSLEVVGQHLKNIDGARAMTPLLVLDALINNRDRHHNNWAVLVRGRERLLAPAFDHGTSLGSKLTDTARRRLLEQDPRLTEYTRRATAWRWEPGRRSRQTLVDLAADAVRRWGVAADLRAAVEDLDVEEVVQAPGSVASDLALSLAAVMLQTNRRRLLDGWPGDR